MKFVELSEIDEDKFYRFQGQILSGSELWAYLYSNEPTLRIADLDKIEEIEPTREDLTGEQNHE